jgi:predicted transposase/invertase (TIGR01784 family)
LRKTRFAQELIAEGEQIGEVRGEIQGKLKTIPQLLKEGFSQEKIATILQLTPQQVREYINK